MRIAHTGLEAGDEAGGGLGDRGEAEEEDHEGQEEGGGGHGDTEVAGEDSSAEGSAEDAFIGPDRCQEGDMYRAFLD